MPTDGNCLSPLRVLGYVFVLHLYGCTAVTVSFLDVPQRCVFHPRALACIWTPTSMKRWCTRMPAYANVYTQTHTHLYIRTHR